MKICDQHGLGTRPGDPVGLRRLGPHHLLHRQRGRLQQAQGRDRQRPRGQDHEAHQLPRRHARGLRHAVRHAGRAAADRGRRRQGTDALQGRLVRQRGLPRRLHRRRAAEGPRHGREVRQPVAAGRLPRLFRRRLPDRPGQRRGLPGRAQPAHLRRQPDDQPRRLRLCRRAAVPVPPARVLGRALRPERARDQRPLGAAALHRLLVAGGHQAHRRPASTRSRTHRPPASTR